jgi:hypothetical protein
MEENELGKHFKIFNKRRSFDMVDTATVRNGGLDLRRLCASGSTTTIVAKDLVDNDPIGDGVGALHRSRRSIPLR